MEKLLGQNTWLLQLKTERLILTHIFRGFSPWLVGYETEPLSWKCVVTQSISMAAKKLSVSVREEESKDHIYLNPKICCANPTVGSHANQVDNED